MGWGRNIKSFEDELKRRKNISLAHKGKKKSKKWKESRKKFKPSEKQKRKISDSLKIYYSYPLNKKALLENLKKAIRLRGNLKEFWNKPEMKEFARKRRARQILPTKDTSIEVKIQNFLKVLGIEFFTHQYMKIPHAYQCDILIPSMNLVIECDGDYWHKYPIGNEIDHIRTSELIEKGFKVLRLWEFEIKKMELNDFKERFEVVK